MFQNTFMANRNPTPFQSPHGCTDKFDMKGLGRQLPKVPEVTVNFKGEPQTPNVLRRPLWTSPDGLFSCAFSQAIYVLVISHLNWNTTFLLHFKLNSRQCYLKSPPVLQVQVLIPITPGVKYFRKWDKNTSKRSGKDASSYYKSRERSRTMTWTQTKEN